MPHISATIRYLSFSFWLTLPTMIISGFTHVAANGMTPCSVWLQCPIAYVGHPFFALACQWASRSWCPRFLWLIPSFINCLIGETSNHAKLTRVCLNWLLTGSPFFLTVIVDCHFCSADLDLVHSWVSWASAASSEPLNHGITLEKAHTKLQANCLSTPGASQSLVDYDSSDDSEEGSTSLCLVNSRLTSSHQEAMKKTQDTFGASGDKKELGPESQSRPLVTEESNTLFSVYCDIAPNNPNNTASEVGISHRTVKCFEELQGAIYRLQKKNLFPYNPTALLKLLKHIETIYNKSMTPS